MSWPFLHARYCELSGGSFHCDDFHADSTKINKALSNVGALTSSFEIKRVELFLRERNYNAMSHKSTKLNRLALSEQVK